MYIQLVDKDNFSSPILRIHSDEEEFLREIKQWHVMLLLWLNMTPSVKHMPLSRLDPGVAIIDLLRVLTQYRKDNWPQDALRRSRETPSLAETLTLGGPVY